MYEGCMRWFGSQDYYPKKKIRKTERENMQLCIYAN